VAIEHIKDPEIYFSQKESSMNTRNLWLVSTCFLLLGLLATACGGAPATQVATIQAPDTQAPATQEPVPQESQANAPTSVQFCTMYSTSIKDNGWDRSAHESFLRFQENPGIDIKVLDLKWTEGLYGDEAESAMRAFAESGECDIIWGQGGYNDIIKNVSGDYPKVMFVEVGSGIIEALDNHYHVMHRCFDGMYVLGVLAGKLTKGSAIGAVGTYPAEDVNDAMNGFFDGAKSVNPSLKQKVAFINSWYDPAKAGEAASAQIAAGADQIFMFGENFEVCGENQIMCYGPYIDYSKIYPEAALGSFVSDWEPYYKYALTEWYKVQTTGVKFDGKPYGFTGSMANGGCDVVLSEALVPTLPEDALKLFEDTRQAVKDGTLEVPLDISEPKSE
jgi:basic membrane protein A